AAIRANRAARRRWPGVSVAIDDAGGRYYFDAEEADRATEFFPTFLRHHKGEFAAQPFALADWQRELIIRPAFGWKRRQDGLRRFRKVSLWVAKGNGKSPLGSGTGIYLTLCDREPGAEVYSAATDREQAGIVHEAAKHMVEDSPELSEMAYVWTRSIEVPATRSSFKVLSADVRNKHGFNVHGLIFDELHAQRTRDLWETLVRGMVKRLQPLLFVLSTAGDDEDSIAFEEYEYAKRVMAGSIDDATVLPVIFEAGPEDDWTKQETWAKANPGLGTTVKLEALRTACKEAQNEPRKRNDFKRYHCNQWVNQAVAWLTVESWDRCAGQLVDQELRQHPCTAGLDMAQKIDLAAFSVTFRLPLAQGQKPQELEVKREEGDLVVPARLSLNLRLAVVTFFWMPEETMRQREKEDRIPYSLWAEQGLVTPTEGNVIDDDRIFRDITEVILPRFPKLKEGEIGYDPAFSTSLALRLQSHGLKMVEVLQNYRHMNEPAQAFEALVIGRRVVHAGSRLMRSHVENVAVRSDDAGRIRPVKTRRRKRIDGVVATLMGLGRMLVSVPQRSVYDERVEKGEETVLRWL
ncbi:MAG TPA: terminase TerL endonuclease subunit, partial [Actinomycetes bacterium]|nr:terminase TerL endonuclease subunit [Actinomycetes bacterium]